MKMGKVDSMLHCIYLRLQRTVGRRDDLKSAREIGSNPFDLVRGSVHTIDRNTMMIERGDGQSRTRFKTFDGI